MTRRYVIFYWLLFSERDWVRYSCDELTQRGYDVRVVQISEALEGVAADGMARRFFTGLHDAETPGDKTELSRIVEGLSKEDLILIASPVNPQYLWLHRELGQRGLSYVILTTGRVAEEIPWQHSLGRGVPQLLAASYRAFTHFAYRVRFHLGLIHDMGLDYFRIPPPRLWARAGTARPWFATDGLHLWRSRVVDVESFDVGWARRAEPASSVSGNEPYAVFIDEALCDHPDYRYNRTPPPATRERYFTSLRNLFDRLETECGLKVIVALHPKSDYSPEELPDLFGERKTVRGETPALIRDSSLVMQHNSTSTSYAVLHRKPIFFVTSDEIDASWLRRELDLRSAWLGQQVINIDAGPDQPEGDLKLRPVDERAYGRYEDSFLRSRRAIGAPPMIVVADQFERAQPGR